jgi:hypothetical protein
MGKTITIDDDAYKLLASLKQTIFLVLPFSVCGG